MPDLERAMLRALERKNAVAQAGEDPETFMAAPDQIRLMFSGFDVDADQLTRLAEWMASRVVFHQRGPSIAESLCGTWLDGILIGLFLAELDDAGRIVDATSEEGEPA